jgi:hypothetical protein
MATAVLTQNTSDRIVLSKLLWVAPLAIAASIAANLVIYFIMDALFGVAWQPMFIAPSVVGSTVAYLLVATIVFAIVARFAKRPVWLYQRIAIVALLLSFFAPISALMGMAAPPGVEASAAPLDTVVTMLLTHIAAYLISVNMFVRLARD